MLFLDMDDFRPRFRDKEGRLREEDKGASPGTVAVAVEDGDVVGADPGVERRLDVRLPRFRVGEVKCGAEVEEEERGDSEDEVATSVATESDTGLEAMAWVSCSSRK